MRSTTDYQIFLLSSYQTPYQLVIVTGHGMLCLHCLDANYERLKNTFLRFKIIFDKEFWSKVSQITQNVEKIKTINSVVKGKRHYH